MKKLIIAVALAAGLAFPLASQAEVNAFGVSLPAGQAQVSDDIRGGTIAEYPFYPISAQRISNVSEPVQAQTLRQDVYTVYGIHLSGDDVI